MSDNADLIARSRSKAHEIVRQPDAARLLISLADALERSEALVRDARAFGERWVARAEKAEAQVEAVRELADERDEETEDVYGSDAIAAQSLVLTSELRAALDTESI